MDIEPSVQVEESWCLNCNASLPDETQRCNSCGYSLTGVRVYNPKHFLWLAFLLSAMIPIYLAASNWGKIGKTRTKSLWLGFGFLGFTLMFTILAVLPDTGSVGGRLIGYAINLPIGYMLRDMQRPVYRAALRLGAQPGSLFKGSVFGLGVLICALALPMGSVVAKYELDFRRGAQLLEQGNFEGAASVFEEILHQDPDDDGAVFNLAICHAAMERWDEAAQGFEKYLRRNERDPAAYAFLAHIRFAQGRHQEAESVALKARALDPNIFEKLFE